MGYWKSSSRILARGSKALKSRPTTLTNFEPVEINKDQGSVRESRRRNKSQMKSKGMLRVHSAGEKSQEELAYECQEFVMLMGEAAETDAESNRAGKPALKKLQMLPNVVNTLSK